VAVAGLRERKKQATRVALREAALRLALERGPENVRIDDIAEAAGVSPRTYNNYFSSREQAIVAAVAAERESGIAAAVTARPAEVPLADAVVDAVVEQYCAPRSDALLMITTSPALRAAYVDAAAVLEPPLAAAIVDRVGAARLDAQVLAAAVGAAVGVALREWLPAPAQKIGSAGGLVVPRGSLPDLLRSALAPLRPALDAASR
jgi:AcrR family transcriptional regulator